MTLWQIAWNIDQQAEVGRVTSSGQGTLALSRLVKWALVDVLQGDLTLNDWLEPHEDHPAVENLGVGLAKHTVGCVPLASLEEHTVDVDTLWWRWELFDVSHVVDDFEVHIHGIDRDLHLSGVVLQGAGQEAVSEVELVDPEVLRDLCVNPSLEELETLLQVLDEATERLQRWVALLEPHSWHFTVENLEKGAFELS